MEITLSYQYPEPVTIEALRAERALHVAWNDGHRSSFDSEYLRWRCPCAVCQGEGGAPGVLSFTKELQPEQIEMVDIQLVGRYAVALVWRDGHDSGIYSFEYLRAICPCDDCRYS